MAIRVVEGMLILIRLVVGGQAGARIVAITIVACELFWGKAAGRAGPPVGSGGFKLCSGPLDASYKLS